MTNCSECVYVKEVIKCGYLYETWEKNEAVMSVVVVKGWFGKKE